MTRERRIIENRIIASLKQGLTQKDSAKLSGRDEDTISRWKSEDADFAETLTTLTSNTLIQLLNEWQEQNLLEPIIPETPYGGNYPNLLES